MAVAGDWLSWDPVEPCYYDGSSCYYGTGFSTPISRPLLLVLSNPSLPDLRVSLGVSIPAVTLAVVSLRRSTLLASLVVPRRWSALLSPRRPRGFHWSSPTQQVTVPDSNDRSARRSSAVEVWG